ncbi:ATP-dependent Lon protease [Photobacterium japonica]|uniref:ATP-dependent Lon protease n=1 Tax=Photobacterium japonica TaxID=2910235 RepID=UPI003D0E7D6A
MLVSPVQVGAPTIAPSINPPTEQAARDNRVRDKIVPPTESTAAQPEKRLTSDEKQFKKPGWDPSEHPDYHDAIAAKRYGYQQELEQLVTALSADRYMAADSELGYSMHIKLPRALLEELAAFNDADRTRGVVAHKYAKATVPNPPTEYLVVL